jgi:TonB family protein
MAAVRRPPRPARSASVAFLALGCLAAACRTAPPPPPAVAVPPAPAPGAEPAPPPTFVRVTGSRLNVRQTPVVSAPTVARVRRGELLVVLERDGDWVRVTLADGSSGWVSARYVRPEAPCAADKPGAELLSDVPLSVGGGAIGAVVIEATVDASGKVVATKVVRDSTGSPELVKRAGDEVRAFRFSPPVRDCRAVPFVYTYTRNF